MKPKASDTGLDSGIALKLTREVPRRPSRAARLHAIIDLHQERQREIDSLGERPQRYQPFRRMRWDRERKRIGEYYFTLAREMAIDAGMLTPAYENAMRAVWL